MALIALARGWISLLLTTALHSSRSSLLPVNKLLVPFKAYLLLLTDYQCFCYLSIVKRENSQLPDLGVTECNHSRVSVTFTKQTVLTGTESGIIYAIHILPIDVEVQVATLSDNRDSVGLVQTLFKE